MTAPRIKRALKICTLALMATGLLFAQETRKTIVNASKNPADDTKENSSAVPDVYAITGHFDRIVVLRFKYKADLLAGMEQMVKQEHIQNEMCIRDRKIALIKKTNPAWVDLSAEWFTPEELTWVPS